MNWSYRLFKNNNRWSKNFDYVKGKASSPKNSYCTVGLGSSALT